MLSQCSIQDLILAVEPKTQYFSVNAGDVGQGKRVSWRVASNASDTQTWQV